MLKMFARWFTLLVALSSAEGFLSNGVKMGLKSRHDSTPLRFLPERINLTNLKSKAVQSSSLLVQHHKRSTFSLDAVPSRTFPAVLAPSKAVSSTSHREDASAASKKALTQRIITGLFLAVFGSLWITSGKAIFAFGFFILSVIGQNEYLNMLEAIGLHDISSIYGILAAAFSSIFAVNYPQFHSYVLPLSASVLMSKLLLFGNKLATIEQVTSTFFGMFYLCYLPSFWILVRFLPDNILKTIATPRDGFEVLNKLNGGALLTWTTWCAIAFSDIGAFFVGKKFGKHKLSTLSVAAGNASPNKSIEGALGGFLCGSLVSMLGAYILQWPNWKSTGLAYGLTLSVVALVGDLTASMMKRDANVKDTGKLLPGHGGLLDRIDSYLLTAPIAHLFLKHILPSLGKVRASIKL